MSVKGDIGVIGLAVMGQNLILNMVQQKAPILSVHTL